MNTCPWPADFTSCGGDMCEPLKSMEPEDQAKFIQYATDTLDSSTNGIFGVCEVTIRPCTTGCESGMQWLSYFGRGPYPWGELSVGSWVPFLWAGQWYNLGCGCTNSCSCAIEGARSLLLPGPVQGVTKILVDGVELPASAYKVMYGRALVRTDGERWPACQDLLADPTEPNTFEVTYMKGVPVPTGGQLAVGKLACELAKAYCGDKSCELPQRLQTLTRQGVTIGFQDSFQNLDMGRTGIYAIDSWIASVTKPKPFVSVASPDKRPNGNRGSQWVR